MNTETRGKLRKECISALSEATNVLNRNIPLIREDISNLKKRVELISNINQEILSQSSSLRPEAIFLDTVVIEPTEKAIETLHEVLPMWEKYARFIETQFEKLEPELRDSIDRLLQAADTDN